MFGTFFLANALCCSEHSFFFPHLFVAFFYPSLFSTPSHSDECIARNCWISLSHSEFWIQIFPLGSGLVCFLDINFASQIHANVVRFPGICIPHFIINFFSSQKSMSTRNQNIQTIIMMSNKVITSFFARWRPIQLLLITILAMRSITFIVIIISS